MLPDDIARAIAGREMVCGISEPDYHRPQGEIGWGMTDAKNKALDNSMGLPLQ
jgi:hypothetical protein